MPSNNHVKVYDTLPWVQSTVQAGNLSGPFPFPFLIFEAEHLIVCVNGIQASPATYVVDGVGVETGGTVTFSADLVAGDILTMNRTTDVERLTDFTPGGSFRATAMNDELDRQTVMTQDQAYKLDYRVLQFPMTSPQPPQAPLLPPGEAGKRLGWADNFNLQNYDAIEGPTLATVDGGNVASPITPIQFRRDVQAAIEGITPNSGEPIYDTINKILRMGDAVTPGGIPVSPLTHLAVSDVMSPEFGAKCDGVTDDKDAIQAALDKRGIVILPKGPAQYMISDLLLCHSDTIVIWGGSFIKFIFEAWQGGEPISITRGGVLSLRFTNEISENVTLINPLIDANEMPINGIGVGSSLEMDEFDTQFFTASNYQIIGGHVKNCWMSDEYGGGKGVTAQRGVKNFSCIGTRITECAQGVNTAPFWRNNPAGGAPPTLEFCNEMIFSSLVMENVGRPIVMDEVIDSSETGADMTASSAIFTDIIGRHVGDPRYKWHWSGHIVSPGPVDGMGGGVIMAEGGNRALITDCLFTNDASDAKIGGFIRGHWKHTTIRGCRLETVNGLKSIINLDNVDGNISQLNEKNWPSVRNRIEVEVRGPVDYVLEWEPHVEFLSTLRCRYNEFEVMTDAPLIDWLAPDTEPILNNWMEVRERDTQKHVRGNASDFDGYANFAAQTSLEVLLGLETELAGVRISGSAAKTIQAPGPHPINFGYDGVSVFGANSNGLHVYKPTFMNEQPVASPPDTFPGTGALWLGDDGKLYFTLPDDTIKEVQLANP